MFYIIYFLQRNINTYTHSPHFYYTNLYILTRSKCFVDVIKKKYLTNKIKSFYCSTVFHIIRLLFFLLMKFDEWCYIQKHRILLNFVSVGMVFLFNLSKRWCIFSLDTWKIIIVLYQKRSFMLQKREKKYCCSFSETNKNKTKQSFYVISFYFEMI